MPDGVELATGHVAAGAGRQKDHHSGKFGRVAEAAHNEPPTRRN
jgi:hypothetical protein